MPITGWICPSCAREAPLSHFESEPCRFVVHPDYANAVLNDRESHQGRTVPSVTQALGCPRSTKIQDSESFSVDPLSLNAPLTGTAWHAAMERAAPDQAGVSEVDLSGVINGIALTGTADRLDEPLLLIEDWKHKSDFGLKYVKKDGAAIEHWLQLSLYAELCEQTLGWRPTKGYIWYHSSVSGKDAMIPIFVKLFSLEETLAAKPHNGKFTVAELLIQAAKPAAMWASLPLAGESQMFGKDKNMCSYCSVKSICWTQAKGAPF